MSTCMIGAMADKLNVSLGDMMISRHVESKLKARWQNIGSRFKAPVKVLFAARAGRLEAYSKQRSR